ncbi:MAG: MFS transporter, partial [Candidatus Thioglobus sp.]|nr:MFS transporter [Candidatus Thioglobus sp.]
MSQHKKILSFAIALACVLLAINFGLRSSLGLFLKPVSETFGYGREVFAFSLALQNLFWGLSQPIAGAFADKFGTSRVIIVGTLFYSLGLYITATADSFMGLHIGAGILIGMGISGTGLGVILPAMARMVSPEKRAMALGIGTAAGSAGQFLLIPVAREFLVAYGWQTALIIMAIGALSMILFSPVFKGDEIKNTTLDNEPSQTLKEALNEASGHIHYWLLIAGFFVCGFQLAFIVVHMPSYLADKGFDSSVAAASLSIIGLCNIFGSLISGHLSGIYSKKWILTYIYAARSIIIVLFLITPISTFTIYAFSFATGFLWLATVP